MSDSRTFTIAGTSTFRGENTYRFANGSARKRTIVLKRYNHLDIRLIDLPHPMTKDQAISFLQGEGFAGKMPKTGRGSGLTAEQLDAHNKIIAASIDASVANEAAVAESNEAWLANL